MLQKFVRLLFEMCSLEAHSSSIGFSFDGTVLELRNLDSLALILPSYYKHKKITSLIRQLNNYGFKTISPKPGSGISHSFSHPGFQRGQPKLAETVRKSLRRNIQPSLQTDSEDDEETVKCQDGSTIESGEVRVLEMNSLLRQQNLDLLKRVRELEDQAKRRCTCQTLSLESIQASNPSAISPPVNTLVRRLSVEHILLFEVFDQPSSYSSIFQ